MCIDFISICALPLARGLVRPRTSEILLRFRKEVAHDCFSKWSRAACREEDLVVYIVSSKSQGFCLIAKAHKSAAACQCLQLAALTNRGNWTEEEKLCEPNKVPFSSYLRTINANNWKHFCSTSFRSYICSRKYQDVYGNAGRNRNSFLLLFLCIYCDLILRNED